MVNIRKIVFGNDYYYHIFNRGMDRRVVFENRYEYKRALDLLAFYQYREIPLRYSLYKEKNYDIQQKYMQKMIESGKLVEIICYCLMPNHFHLLLKQRVDNGVITYISNFMNAYTKYYNVKHKRVGRLFQGKFGAVAIGSYEHLLHETRYIHINPPVASLITIDQLETYQWSSYPAYNHKQSDHLIEQTTIDDITTMVPDYESFVKDQILYAKEQKLRQKENEK